MTDYITTDDFKQAAELTGESYADPDIEMAIVAASRAIEKICRRRFYPDDDAATVRYYSPRNIKILEINDLIEVSEVAVGRDGKTFPDVWTENDDFILTPLNADEDGRPWEDIRSLTSSLPLGLRRVRVTGMFGWATVPDEVKSAALMLSTRLMKRAREAPFGIIHMGGLDTISAARVARSDPDVISLLGPFVRMLIA